MEFEAIRVVDQPVGIARFQTEGDGGRKQKCECNRCAAK